MGAVFVCVAHWSRITSLELSLNIKLSQLFQQIFRTLLQGKSRPNEASRLSCRCRAGLWQHQHRQSRGAANCGDFRLPRRSNHGWRGLIRCGVSRASHGDVWRHKASSRIFPAAWLTIGYFGRTAASCCVGGPSATGTDKTSMAGTGWRPLSDRPGNDPDAACSPHHDHSSDAPVGERGRSGLYFAPRSQARGRAPLR